MNRSSASKLSEIWKSACNECATKKPRRQQRRPRGSPRIMIENTACVRERNGYGNVRRRRWRGRWKSLERKKRQNEIESGGCGVGSRV
jgi:hypothetical protein